MSKQYFEIISDDEAKSLSASDVIDFFTGSRQMPNGKEEIVYFRPVSLPAPYKIDFSGVKWPFNGYAPGNYMSSCAVCKKQMTSVDKRCFVCLPCAMEKAQEVLSTLPAQDGEFIRQLKIKADNHAIEYAKNLEANYSKAIKDIVYMASRTSFTEAVNFICDNISTPTPAVTTQGEGKAFVDVDFPRFAIDIIEAAGVSVSPLDPGIYDKVNALVKTAMARLAASLPEAGGPGDHNELADLKEWKRQQLELLGKLDLQAIGRELKVGLGETIADKILPAIKQLKAGRQSAGVWVTDKLPPTGMIKSYFCKLWSEHLKQEYRGLILFNKTGWAQTEYKILAWLDDSLQPATTGEGLLNEILHHIDTWADEPDRAMRLVRKITMNALATPNATERQEGEKENN